MKHKLELTISSLLSILFLTFHFADDIARGFESGGKKNYFGILILFVLLYATLVLKGRLSGYIIIFLGSLLGAGVPLIHMTGAGLVGGRIANSNGKLFWIFTLLALGVTSLFSVVLAARGLWSLRRNPALN